MTNEIIFTIPVPYIESVNKLHSSVIRYRNVKVKDKKTGKLKTVKKKYADTILSDSARKAMHSYFISLEKYLPKDTLPKDIKDFKNADITYGFYMKQSIKRRDYDNCIKIFQDCMSHHLGFNDACIITGHTYKRLISKKDRTRKCEFIYVKIKNKSRTDKELLVKEEDLINRLGYSIN